MKIEIRAAEGGDDSKLLVVELLKLYRAASSKYGFALKTLNSTFGKEVLAVSGNTKFFEGEAGGHRFQRVPPTEKTGRTHTSTVTVAVIDDTNQELEPFDERKIVWTFFKASGPGGQHRNKTLSAARATYGELVVESKDSKEQSQNRKSAIRKLKDLYYGSHEAAQLAETNERRKKMIGSGERGDKIRTYRIQDDMVKDNRTGNKTSFSSLQRGDWSNIKL